MVIAKYERVSWEEVNELKLKVWGIGGFGHTGKK
jgi:dUTPase